ncbi:MAG TPA: hypothetical protein H9739_01915 [Candidatus Agathobaculum pullistercoris]|nr:hypothetical protein [uncultured Agathobaculum sp.]HIX10322.1 hypothetical protein [Candidatus Agathobaculum pullistercoris]
MKPIRMIPVLLSLLLLGGCTFPSGDDLLAAPRPSTNYQTLQVELEDLLASGVSYTAPTGGENRSSIQLVDLDGDGVEEAIAFFRGSTSATSNNFQIYIYKRQGDQYVCTGTVEGQGTAVQSVDYPVITPDGRRGMVVTWRLTGDGTGALTMCDFDNACVPGVLLETEYSAMELTDLTGDGARDLLLLTTDPGGRRVARLYQYQDDELLLAGEAATSPETVSVERMRSGRVQMNQPAVFAEERMANGVGLTTDIFVYNNDTLINLALDGEDSITRSTYRPVSVYAADINADGITELPRAVLMAGYTDAAASDAVFMLDWYVYSVDRPPVAVATTYDNISDGWRLNIDAAWHDRITAVKTTDSGLSSVTFSEYISANQQIPLFTIYTATGSTREYYAGRSDLLQLGESAQAVYFARIADDAEQSALAISEQDIKNGFSLVKQDWNN